jgi:hypothetical protein
MVIAVRHIFEPTDDGVFDPEEHRRLANDFPAGKLPGVRSVTVYRNTDQQIMVGEAILDNEATLKSWEDWNNSPEGDEWREKFFKTGKLVERIIFEVVE